MTAMDMPGNKVTKQADRILRVTYACFPDRNLPLINAHQAAQRLEPLVVCITPGRSRTARRLTQRRLRNTLWELKVPKVCY